jgi:4'-phosphopantetheinyl transferase
LSAPRATQVDLWLVDLERCAQALFELDDASRSLLKLDHSSAEHPQQQQKQLAHIALRLVLARNLGPATSQRRFERTARGQPVLITPPGEQPVAFSLSHTNTHALIGVTFGPMIGVDLEHPRAISMTPARRELIERAAAPLTARDLPITSQARTLQAWVRLEALAKADGSGIGRMMTAIGAVGGTKPAASASAALACAERLNLAVHDLALPGAYGAVAIDASANLPLLNTLPDNVDAIRSALGLS